MIHCNIALRWVVIGLFALTAVEFGVAVVAKPRPWTSAVNHALHFVMAVAMVLMAWPWSAKLPTTGPAVFFLLAAMTFGAMAIFAIHTTSRRELYAYHGLMMLATAWMYVVMDSQLMPTQSSPQPDMSMPGMNMSAMSMSANHRIAHLVQRTRLDRCRRLRGRSGFLDVPVFQRAATRDVAPVVGGTWVRR